MSRQGSGGEACPLAVDDEPNARDLLASSLRFAGSEASTVVNGYSAYRQVADESPDFIVLDVAFPDMDGFIVTCRLHEVSVQIPILLLTARDGMCDKIQGFIVGGGDYVTKPFDPEEVVARTRTVLCRTLGAEEDDGLLRVGDLVIGEDAHEVTGAGVSINLSSTGFKLLCYLVINERRVISKMQIPDHVREYDWDGEAVIVEPYAPYLRRKLAVEGASGEPIHTKHGVGYTLCAEG